MHIFPAISNIFFIITFSTYAWAKDEIVPLPDIMVESDILDMGILGAREVLDTPFSVHRYERDLFDAQQARTINDILKNNLAAENFAMGGNFDHVAIRGLPLDTRASFRRDGLPFPGLGDHPLEAVEHVDVLHGVSAMLYGFNRPGGVVNYVSKRPPVTPQHKVNMQARQYGGYYAHVDSGAPLGRQGGQRWNLAAEKNGDFGRNGDGQRWMGSTAFTWQASPALRLEWDADFQHKSRAAQAQLPLLNDGSLPTPPDPRTLLGQPWARYVTDALNGQARLGYDFNDNWRVHVQGAYSGNVRDAVFPNIYEIAPDGEVLDADIWYAPDQRSRILSSQSSVQFFFEQGRLTHELVAGFATYHFKARNLGYLWPPLLLGNIYHPLYLDPPEIPDLPAKRSEKNRQLDWFFADSVTLGEHWQFLGGWRHVDYANVVYSPTGVASNNYRKSAFTHSLAALFQPRSTLSFYLSYAQGLEAGGLAPVARNIVNAGEVMPPLRTKQYEGGVKTRVRGRLLLSAALFQIDRPLQFIDGSGRYVQDGQQQHRGLELSAHGQVNARLSVVAGARWLDAGVRDNLHEDGERYPYAVAQKQANVFAEYRLPGVEKLFVNAGGYYRGKRFFDADNQVSVPGYMRWDAGLRYTSQWRAYPLTWRVQVNNVFNRFYWVSAAWDGLTMGDARTVKLALEITL
jgi:iron complex outermembrane recepter protein